MALPSNLNSFFSAPLAQAWPPNVQWTKRPLERQDIYDRNTGLVMGAVCHGEIVEVTDGEKTITLEVSACAHCKSCGGNGFTIDYSSCEVSACKECGPEVISTAIEQGKAKQVKPWAEALTEETDLTIQQWAEKYEQGAGENCRIDIDTEKAAALLPLETSRKYRED